MMDSIIAVDCSVEVLDILKEMLGEEAELSGKLFEDIDNLQDYRMIVVESADNQDELLQRIKKLRYACYFRKIYVQ